MNTETHNARWMFAKRQSDSRTLVDRFAAALALHWPLLLIVAIGVALRLWIIGVSALDPRFSDADDGDYYRRALRFAVEGVYIDDNWLIRPPLHVFFYAFWLRIAFLLGNPAHGITLIKLAQVVVSAIMIVLGYASARRLFNSERAGLLFAAFIALWFSFVEQPSVLFSELLYLCLFQLHFWLLLRYDANERPRDLALSGFALGASALTRSPALYSIVFVVLWLFVRERTKNREQRTEDQAQPRRRSSVLGSAVLVVACCLAVVLPWTARNYIVYQRIIPIDTLGQTNLWLDLDAVDKRNEHIAELRTLPQADRAAYAMGKAREILAADPLRPFRPMWDTFRHIWKLQFVEDYFVKRSFFSRPLRAAAPLGLAGDVLWLVFTVAGLVGLASRPREGLHNRLFVLAWLGYSFFTVLVFHVEPRYLLPIWTLIGMYGAWTLAQIGRREYEKKKSDRWFKAIQISLAVAFFALLLTYRNYPAIIASGLSREVAMVRGERAYFAGDYLAAEQAFRAALAAQPEFVDAQVELALALAAQGRIDAAKAALPPGGSRMADVVGAVLERDTGNAQGVFASLQEAELISGEDIQTWALKWLRPPATAALTLGDGTDLGYVAGFSGAESGANGTYRWLSGDGRIALPLPAPPPLGTSVILRMTSGRTEPAALDVWIGDQFAGKIAVTGDGWREYRVAIPPELAGQSRLDVRLRAPTFIPARIDPASTDARALSLMIGAVRVQ